MGTNTVKGYLLIKTQYGSSGSTEKITSETTDAAQESKESSVYMKSCDRVEELSPFEKANCAIANQIIEIVHPYSEIIRGAIVENDGTLYDIIISIEVESDEIFDDVVAMVRSIDIPINQNATVADVKGAKKKIETGFQDLP